MSALVVFGVFFNNTYMYMHIYTNVTLNHFDIKINIFFISCCLPDSLLIQGKNTSYFRLSMLCIFRECNNLYIIAENCMGR